MEKSIIISGEIETGTIRGICKWRSKLFPVGFEFFFDSLTFKRMEKTENEEEITIFNPSPNDQTVIIGDATYETLPKSLKDVYNEDTGRIEMSFKYCVKYLGVSHWKLIELLEEQNRQALEDAIMAVINDRDYEVTTLTYNNGKYEEVTATAKSLFGGR